MKTQFRLIQSTWIKVSESLMSGSSLSSIFKAQYNLEKIKLFWYNTIPSAQGSIIT